ncbi:enoyl-CoA hydratase [Chelatococcus sp. SYSU_G07232]|uniref:Enoyl-CoA hydratase n=1 Tax=Chelatococcus albus TaxID=3047466 RepID=A0ABT7AJW3_9HYPH|nr:enoyl-CoA hydratase [Chelatococcus sp. SYSU_G07232]MDJ1159400.1 enoyl-CoA hydratase [Chelatococcus sp. SYSU_G07232]
MVATLPSPTPRLTLAVDGPVATLAIANAEKRNALDFAMWEALPALVRTVEATEGVRVLVLRGAGDTPFASGADIAEFETVRASAAGGRAYEAANEAAFAALAACRLPVIAMIRRFCLGGGMGLALACDLRLAAEGTLFGIPAARLGVGYPPAAMSMIVAAVGVAAAKDLFFTARRVDAAEARTLGLVQRVVADPALEKEVYALARTIAANAPLTIRAAKRAIATAAALPGATDAAELAALADACFDSADYAEGRAAFLARREPVFRGA